MKMLLRDVTIAELGTMLERNKGCTSAPQLVDPAARRRARKTARENGLWDSIGRNLDTSRDIPVIKRSTLRTYLRTGNRGPHQAAESRRSTQLELAATALWLEHPQADLDYLQNLLWAYCDDYTWVMAAHIYAVNDLGSTILGARLAEILFAFKDQIEEEVAERVHDEIQRRIFDNVSDYRNTEFWHTAKMNWNHVCNGAVIRTALLEIESTAEAARLIHPMIQNMTYALDGFTDDGGCEEGPGYWTFGFGHFVMAAYALHCRTGGELNIMSDAKVEKICRYPLATHIEGLQRVSFADSGWGSVPPLTALQINHFYNIPELYELCARRPRKGMKAARVPDTRNSHKIESGAFSGRGPLAVRDMNSLALFKGEQAKDTVDHKDYVLPDLGMVKMRGKPGRKQMTVAALAGHNDVPHNHNDIGSFQVYSGGRMLLTDPGSPLYNRQTFSSRRYEILFTRSRGHSVPIINGKEQKAGSQYCGKLSVEGMNEDGTKIAVIDMSKAYPRGTVKKLIRSLELDSKKNSLLIEDSYTFSKKPKSLEEAFVTFEKAAVVKKGKAVRIGPARGGAVLFSEQPGKFRVKVAKEDPIHIKPGTPDLQRITFVPSKLEKELKLCFSLK